MRSVAARRCLRQNSLSKRNYVGLRRCDIACKHRYDPASGGVRQYVHMTLLLPFVWQCLQESLLSVSTLALPLRLCWEILRCAQSVDTITT
jgi:hypothetical protein